ncbi:MAG TPA: thioredoxin-disulfide reductase [Clostridiales bacterium]|jgi:thioredoxin reductase (NADPH)|nr:thioredoxin-disulfide reductase [Clostridiales bacterium]
MHDLIIIGGGPAGLTAALYAARSGIDTIVYEKEVLGGKITAADHVENYPAFVDGVNGFELGELMANQAKKYGAKISFEEVNALELKDKIKTVHLSNKKVKTKAVILSMGSKNRKLGLEGEDNLVGRGVSYCATCDGNFFKGQDVAIVGGANSAVSEALYLSKIAKTVHIIYRRENFRAEKVHTDRLKNTPNIISHLNSEIIKLNSDDFLKGVVIKNNKTKKTSELAVNGLFVAIGHIPNTDLVEGQVTLDPKKYIITDQNMATNLAGVFAAGDIRSETFRQVVTACADGARATESVIEYLGRL